MRITDLEEKCRNVLSRNEELETSLEEAAEKLRKVAAKLIDREAEADKLSTLVAELRETVENRDVRLP